MSENVMKQIKVAKVTVNIAESDVGEDVDRAYRLLEKITGKEPVKTESSGKSKTFGKRAGLNLAVKATLRGEKAEEFLEKVIPASEGIKKESFDGNGNFSFGVSEYIDVPGIDYESEIGMKGFEVAVNLERPGYRVRKRDHKPSNIGNKHRVTDSEAIDFIEEKFDSEVEN